MLVLDAGRLGAAALAGLLPPAGPDHGPERHEARLGDQAVFVDLRSPVGWPERQSWDARFDAALVKLLAALDRAHLRAVLADDGLEHHWLTLYTDDGARVVSVVGVVLRSEGLWEHATVRWRLGPRGAHEQQIKQTHAEGSRSAPP
jgi:hypothetical protein